VPPDMTFRGQRERKEKKKDRDHLCQRLPSPADFREKGRGKKRDCPPTLKKKGGKRREGERELTAAYDRTPLFMVPLAVAGEKEKRDGKDA